jgi:hypothetical protein
MTYVYASVRQYRKVDVYAIYTEAVTHEGATAGQDPDEVIWIRNPDLAAFLNRKVAEERDRGVTITEIATRGNISRQQFNRWRGKGGPQSIPDAQNLIEVCEANGWDTAEALRVLGWGDAARADDDHIRQATSSLLEVLRDDDVTPEDAEEAVAQLRLLESLLRARAERRRRDREN